MRQFLFLRGWPHLKLTIIFSLMSHIKYIIISIDLLFKTKINLTMIS
jgi:hypothetical protein